MYQLLILLLLFNLSVFTWNVVLSPDASDVHPALVEPDIPALELRHDVENVVYSSNSAGTQSSCYTIGPYNSERAAQLVGGKVRGFGLAVQVRAMRSMETLNFLVYIPPLAGYEEAEKVAKDIAGFDVQDVLIINEGPYRNAISLGFFNNLNKAKRHAEYIRYLGYDAHYTEQQAAREVFWLDYDEPFGSNAPVQTWSAAIDATSEVQRIPRACKS
ncbi:MAG: SPOR domain-containing protein [Gammaproteobacteria bacterium]|nr:SPOR domain-containing protein [Gammaproteobacteria bacterium]MBU1724095.1 SPOR domain-containing protein [Gammaproteobacteria bacterium]MBU2006829.1 SPOR domain-containing protein [Gammaproteobacteria bacterium]